MASDISDPSQAAADENAYEGADVEVSPTEDASTDPEGEPKPGGLGGDGTIPSNPDGVAAGLSDTASHFNPEEDEESA
ncbi:MULTISPECIES: hypothetical protein [Microbacterium]|uniref:hypothetical protein n=1 Tax=Microbacterium TaxID=33882 RepID=UPI002787E6A6|nr:MULTISPECIES: hypothetical protein [Microbacterium]MDQ1082624.1 hypothetical protein [Microbacterium sp. SORGH_AS_0344]MDQ1168605.1 hypothetical protein [Microbacterium proteolyticum]